MTLVFDKTQTATAALNPGKVLDHTRISLPIVGTDGVVAICELVVVLKAGAAADMAAYQAIVPPGTKVDDMLMSIARFGSKLHERDAAKIFGAGMSHIDIRFGLMHYGPLDVTSCAAPVGFTLVAPAAFPTTVPVGGSTSLTVSCTTPAAGAAALVGDLVCQSNATANGGVITVPLSCSGTPLVVPVMGNMGKILLASLVIGLGLLGMGMRRQG